jgi:transposase
MKLQADSLWLATQPVDMRTGIDGLSLHVQQALGRAPCDGTAYVFSNRRRTRLKLVCWDGNGVWMCLRRLHRGQFVWPENAPMLAAPNEGVTSDRDSFFYACTVWRGQDKLVVSAQTTRRQEPKCRLCADGADPGFSLY